MFPWKNDVRSLTITSPGGAEFSHAVDSCGGIPEIEEISQVLHCCQHLPWGACFIPISGWQPFNNPYVYCMYGYMVLPPKDVHIYIYIYIYICIEWENKCYLLTTNWDAQLSTIGGNKSWTHCKSTASSRPVIKWLWAESVNRPGFGVYSQNLVPSWPYWLQLGFPNVSLTRPCCMHTSYIYL